MNEQTTIDKPLLVTLEGAEVIVPSSKSRGPYMLVSVMDFSEEARSYNFPMTIDNYVSLLRSNSLSGIPKNPDYPRFEMIDKSGEPLSEVSQDNLEHFGIHLKRTERAA